MLLFTPGPTPVSESVRRAMSTETIHHRTPEFEAIFANVRASLSELFGMEEVLMLASSGTGAMEGALTNLVHSKLLVVNSGKFGERFGKIAAAHAIPFVEIKSEWNYAPTASEVLALVQQHPDIDAIAIQVCESAGGLRHHVEEIAQALKEHNSAITVIADGITAVGVEKIDVTHIDCLISGSQKALMLPPGMALMGLSGAAIEKIGAGRGWYFNLAIELKNQRKNTTAWTAPTTLVIGLEQMIRDVHAQGGWEELYRTSRLRAEASRMAMEAIGLVIYPHTPAIAMSAISHPEAKTIRAQLKKHFDISVAAGQDHIKETTFRINHMGLISPHEACAVVNAVEMVLAQMGLRPYDGSANRVFSQHYYGL